MKSAPCRRPSSKRFHILSWSILFLFPPASRRRKISDIVGKYRSNPDQQAKDHDRGFADAAAG